ncbi:hypothetical protein U9R90_18840 [Streptomyces sp. E11-3]|uniref:hypothetical protein n=1 Tax=Streptomyces sp. E11-3 TaxID=3110112 RepID=UPI0039814158
MYGGPSPRGRHAGCWDQATDPDNGETYHVCLLHIPANKTTAAFSKPVDPIVGELIDAWKDVRPAQPDITDRKTGQRRQHLFCYRAQLIGIEIVGFPLVLVRAVGFSFVSI